MFIYLCKMSEPHSVSVKSFSLMCYSYVVIKICFSLIWLLAFPLLLKISLWHCINIIMNTRSVYLLKSDWQQVMMLVLWWRQDLLFVGWRTRRCYGGGKVYNIGCRAGSTNATTVTVKDQDEPSAQVECKLFCCTCVSWWHLSRISPRLCISSQSEVLAATSVHRCATSPLVVPWGHRCATSQLVVPAPGTAA